MDVLGSTVAARGVRTTSVATGMVGNDVLAANFKSLEVGRGLPGVHLGLEGSINQASNFSRTLPWVRNDKAAWKKQRDSSISEKSAKPAMPARSAKPESNQQSLRSSFLSSGGEISSSSSSSFSTSRMLVGKQLDDRKPRGVRRTLIGKRGLVIASAAISPGVHRINRTERILDDVALGNAEAGGAGGAGSYAALKRADANWERVRTMKEGEEAGPAPQIVTRQDGRWQDSGLAPTDSPVWDVVVCGGTLGIFFATALALKGKKVAIVERLQLRGRDQEWNISKEELQVLVNEGLLNEEDLKSVISIEMPENRCGFNGGVEFYIKGILDIGVSPVKLLEILKNRFLAAGGVLLEQKELLNAKSFDDGVVISISGQEPLVTHLLIDAMGHASPIVRQIRWGKKPDGICLVVGSCGRGFLNNRTGDLMYSTHDIRKLGKWPCQLFWEAFPTGSGPLDRTTYLFTYVDGHPERPSLELMMETYLNEMPQYQGVQIEDIQFLRFVFAMFPTYRDSPLPAAFDRVLQVGDASGIQSPLSFGGFGSVARHLKRLASGITDALDSDLLSKENLSQINQYQPNLSTAWMLQRAMSVPVGSNPPPDFINKLLSANFQSMQGLGEPVLKPFLQDVTQFGPLSQTLAAMATSQPQLVPTIVAQIGIEPMVDWMGHFTRLGAYSFLSSSVSPVLRTWVSSLSPEEQFRWKRRMEAWEFGSGLDYHQ